MTITSPPAFRTFSIWVVTSSSLPLTCFRLSVDFRLIKSASAGSINFRYRDERSAITNLYSARFGKRDSSHATEATFGESASPMIMMSSRMNTGSRVRDIGLAWKRMRGTRQWYTIVSSAHSGLHRRPSRQDMVGCGRGTRGWGFRPRMKGLRGIVLPATFDPDAQCLVPCGRRPGRLRKLTQKSFPACALALQSVQLKTALTGRDTGPLSLRRRQGRLNGPVNLVGVTGFEPVASTSRT